MFLRAIIAIWFVIVVSGCSVARDLITEGTLRLEQTPADEKYMGTVIAYQHDGYVRISGTWSGNSRDGHVDVTLLDPRGEMLAKKRTGLVSPTEHRSRHPATFQADLGVTVPTGSVLRVSVHFEDDPQQ